MVVLVTSEERLTRAADGSIWGATAYKFWKRYLDVFDEVRLLARVIDGSPQSSQMRVNGAGVTVIPLPYYIGPTQYMWRRHALRRATINAFRQGDAVIFRVGSTIAEGLHAHLQKLKAPYGVEVVGDPYDVFAPGVVDHPLRPLLRWWFTRQLKRQCAGACGAAYVTKRVLQARYSCGAFSVSVSDVEINSDALKSAVLSTHYSSVSLSSVDFRDDVAAHVVGDKCRIVTVGSLSQLYKGTDILIRAVARCRKAGLSCELTVVGDGRFRKQLEHVASQEQIKDVVRFVGMVRGPAAVKEHLDSADLFVLPSRTEGLPRALIEAMARGLPCIASNVGGIPELLEPEDLVPPGDVDALSQRILEVAPDSRRRAAMSKRNLAKAGEYREDRLRERRIAFYQHIRAVTETAQRPG